MALRSPVPSDYETISEQIKSIGLFPSVQPLPRFTINAISRFNQEAKDLSRPFQG